jgi:hypothetical protein
MSVAHSADNYICCMYIMPSSNKTKLLMLTSDGADYNINGTGHYSLTLQEAIQIRHDEKAYISLRSCDIPLIYDKFDAFTFVVSVVDDPGGNNEADVINIAAGNYTPAQMATALQNALNLAPNIQARASTNTTWAVAYNAATQQFTFGHVIAPHADNANDAVTTINFTEMPLTVQKFLGFFVDTQATWGIQFVGAVIDEFPLHTLNVRTNLNLYNTYSAYTKNFSNVVETIPVAGTYGDRITYEAMNHAFRCEIRTDNIQNLEVMLTRPDNTVVNLKGLEWCVSFLLEIEKQEK